MIESIFLLIFSEMDSTELSGSQPMTAPGQTWSNTLSTIRYLGKTRDTPLFDVESTSNSSHELDSIFNLVN